LNTSLGHALREPRTDVYGRRLAYADSGSALELIVSRARGISVRQGVANALRWDVPGFFNGKAGTWQLVVDVSSNTVIHFNFVR